MVNFTAFITLVMGITTFFKNNIPGANIFTSWSQKLLAAPPQPYYDREGKFTITYRGYEEEYTVITPVYPTTTFFTTTFTAAPTITDAFATPTALPGKELILFTGTVTSPSFFTLAKEFVCAMFTLPPAVTANAASVVTAFLFGTLLLLAYVGFLASSPPVMTPEDLLYLEEQVYEKDELLKRLRRWHGEDLAELRGRLQVQREGADERLATTIAKHNSAMADKDHEILALRQELAGAELREEQARFKSSDEVIKMHKEIGHLRSVVDDLDQKLEDAGVLAALGEEAQEKIKDADERAIAAAQQALEASLKVEAAEKALKEKIAGERKRAQAAIDEVVAKANGLRDQVKIGEYKIQDMRAEVKDLKAGAVGAASVPMPPILEGKSTVTKEKEVRDRIQTAASTLGALPVFAPAAPDAAAAAPTVAAPEPIAPGAQQEQVRRIRRRAPVGPFPDLRSRQGGKK
ncbi:hypothetical protein M436DRAFT_64353 [Aureobasidium namibiae CBS 147.97]|uniref:Uncharacterized protein n=1 Tax=Aureobasidium namibiae CBS 147.97 TaxID=1043004 RepID=A0A074WH26_9PEZI